MAAPRTATRHRRRVSRHPTARNILYWRAVTLLRRSQATHCLRAPWRDVPSLYTCRLHTTAYAMATAWATDGIIMLGFCQTAQLYAIALSTSGRSATSDAFIPQALRAASADDAQQHRAARSSNHDINGHRCAVAVNKWRRWLDGTGVPKLARRHNALATRCPLLALVTPWYGWRSSDNLISLGVINMLAN